MEYGSTEALPVPRKARSIVIMLQLYTERQTVDGNCVFVWMCVWLMGQQIKRGWMRRVFVCVCAWHTPTRPEGRGGETERCTSCRGCRVSRQGGAADKQRGACTHPLHPKPSTHTWTRTTTLHPTALQEGWGVVGTLSSSKPPLMHNSCTRSNFDISLAVEAGGLKKFQNQVPQHTAHSTFFFALFRVMLYCYRQRVVGKSALVYSYINRFKIIINR